MGQYTSYWMYQRYITIGNQDPIPDYPNYWSVDADGTLPRITKLENDEECGYRPDAQYRWVNMDITKDYYCDECGSITRWVKSNETICVSNFKVKITSPSGDTTEIACNGDPELKNGEVTGYTNYSDIEIGSCVSSVGYYAIYDKGPIDTLTIPSSVKSINDWAFARQIINYLVIEEGLETIGESAFQECWFRGSNNEITLPSTIKEIGLEAFGQVSLNTVTILATTPPTVGNYGIGARNYIYVPDESVEAYKTSPWWSSYASIIKPISEKP